MKKHIYLFILCCLVYTGFSQAVRWGNKSTSPTGKNEYGWAIAADSLGNTYVTGYFDDSLQCGSTGLLKTRGLKDVYVAKLDPDGNFLWSTSFGSTGDDEGYGIAVDNNGNVYVTGYFAGTFKLTATDSLVSIGSYDIFAAKLDPNGNLLAKIREGTTGADYGRDIACTATSGDFALIGDITANTRFFAAKYNSSGTQLWNKQSTGGTVVYGRGVAMDNTGRVYITGRMTGALTTPSIANYGASDIYVVVYNSTGSAIDYSNHFAGTGNDYGNRIHANGAGTRMYLCGAFTYSVNFGTNVGGSPITIVGSPATMYSFVAQFEWNASTFKPMWARSSFNNWYSDITVDRWGYVFVTDDQTYGVYAYPPYGGNYMWIAAPTLVNASAFIYGLAADKYGNIYATGRMTTGVGGSLTFGDSVLVPGTGTTMFVEKISRPVITAPNPGTKSCISPQKGDSILITIAPSMTYKPGNVFTLQMEASGAPTFTNIVSTVGTLTNTTGGVIRGYIPAGTPDNIYLYFRVLTSNPATTAGDQTYTIFYDRPNVITTTDTVKKCPAISGTVTASNNNPNAGGSGLTYTWTPSGGVTPTNSATVTFSGTVSTDYTVTVTDVASGCKDSKSVYKLVHPAPFIDAGNDTNVCRGSSVQLNATHTNIVTFTWTPSATLTGAGTASPVATPTAFITNLTVTGTTAKGCTMQDFMSITSPQTTANAGPVSYNTCLGGAVQLTGTSNGSQGANGQHYQWSPSAGLNNDTLKNPIATPTVTTKYFMVATDTLNGCTGKDSITIAVGTITVTANNGTVTCGSATTLTATSTGSYVTPLSYTWTPSTGLSGTTGTSTSASPIATTTYYVTMTTGNGCSGTAQSKVTVNKPNYNLAFTAVSQLLSSPPFVAQFTNSTPSMASYNFTWNFGDGIVIQNNNTTVFHTYQYNGNYDVTLTAVSIATGCIDTLFKGGYIFCTGGTGCTLTATVTPNGATTKCVGDTVWLTCNTGSGYTYQWNLNGSPISGATSSTYGATVAGNYAVAINDGSCTIISQPKVVSFTSPPSTPTITATGNINVCGGGGSVLLSSNSGYSSYLWNTSATTQNIVVTQPGVYVVNVGAGTPGCTSSASYTVNATPVPAPSICMVEADSMSVNNIIYWDKTGYSSAELDSMIIYREVATNTYMRIGAVSKDSLSLFVDNNRAVGPANGDPNIGAYRYKIQVKDSCGILSAMSPYHNSVWFNDQLTGTFTWNTYDVEGQSTPVLNFNLMRDSANIGDWRVIGSVAGTQTSLNDPTYNTYQFIANWRVDAIGFNCTPTMRHTFNGTQSTLVKAKSNITNNRTTGLGNAVKESVSVYPNPFNNEITVVTALKGKAGKAVLYNVLGEKIHEFTLQSNIQKLDLSDLKAGVYYIKVQNTQVKIVKQ